MLGPRLYSSVRIESGGLPWGDAAAEDHQSLASGAAEERLRPGSGRPGRQRRASAVEAAFVRKVNSVMEGSLKWLWVKTNGIPLLG